MVRKYWNTHTKITQVAINHLFDLAELTEIDRKQGRGPVRKYTTTVDVDEDTRYVMM